LVDALMLADRSKEEICQVKEEMRRFKSGLVNAKRTLDDEEFKKYLDSEDLLLRGKAFLMQSEINRLSRLLHDCNHWFCETSTDSCWSIHYFSVRGTIDRWRRWTIL
jgi:hypothetical protein